MEVVYILHHVKAPQDLESEDIDENAKLIGIYKTEASANAAIKRLKDKPGFCDYPNGFQVNRYNLDEDNWTEGFITV